jgi:hypothetical protein
MYGQISERFREYPQVHLRRMPSVEQDQTLLPQRARPTPEVSRIVAHAESQPHGNCDKVFDDERWFHDRAIGRDLPVGLGDEMEGYQFTPSLRACWRLR